MKVRLFVICMAFVALPLWAQRTDDPILSRIQIEVPSTQQMDQIAERFEIVEREGRFLEVIIPSVYIVEAEKIAGFKAKVLEADIHEKIRRASLADYPSLDAVETMLRNWAQDHSDFVKFEQYGTSTGSLPLMALKLSDNPQIDEEEPAVLLTAATHGDELITVRVLLAVIEKMVQGYGVDPRITRLIDTKEVWFIPVVSPYGYSRKSRYVGWTDPNRDFPWPEKTAHDSIPCIAGWRSFFAEKKFDASIDYHAYGRMYMYPWAYTNSSAADASRFDRLAAGMARFNGYRYGQISKIIYIAKGSSADYFYWEHKAMALAVEVGNSKVPQGPEIDRVIRENIDGALYFIENFDQVK